jgi:hypothetical protein
VIQGAIGMIQGTFDMIQGTFGTLQGTLDWGVVTSSSRAGSPLLFRAYSFYVAVRDHWSPKENILSLWAPIGFLKRIFSVSGLLLVS